MKYFSEPVQSISSRSLKAHPDNEVAANKSLFEAQRLSPGSLFKALRWRIRKILAISANQVLIPAQSKPARLEIN